MLQTIFNVMTVVNFIVVAGVVTLVIIDSKTDSEDEYEFYLDSMKDKPKRVSREKNTTKSKAVAKSSKKPTSKAKATKKTTAKRPVKVQRTTTRKNS